MHHERRQRILAGLDTGADQEPRSKKLCEVCAEVTGATGAGIMLMSGELPQGSVCSTDDVSELIERLQFELGEGPCVDAFRQDRPVLEPDLAAPSVPRWLAFSEPVLGVGVRAVFGFPMRVGAVRLGALNLYRDRPGDLSNEDHGEALLMADVAARTVLAMQAAAPAGTLAPVIEEDGDFPYVVHQASGMVAAQLEATVRQALVRLRALAYGSGRPLHDVAADVVARRLRFDPTTGEANPIDVPG